MFLIVYLLKFFQQLRLCSNNVKIFNIFFWNFQSRKFKFKIYIIPNNIFSKHFRKTLMLLETFWKHYFNLSIKWVYNKRCPWFYFEMLFYLFSSKLRVMTHESDSTIVYVCCNRYLCVYMWKNLNAIFDFDKRFSGTNYCRNLSG